MSDDETVNEHLVGEQDGKVILLLPPTAPLEPEAALRLAAHLVVTADPEGQRFAAVLKAVQTDGDDLLDDFLDETEEFDTGAHRTIGDAIIIAEVHGHRGGEHHKAWVIDQMVRALTGVDYEAWKAAYGADGEYTWGEGIAP